MKLYTVSKIYIILALLAAAVFSPLAYSFAPVIFAGLVSFPDALAGFSRD
jgi:hypothetical protein